MKFSIIDRNGSQFYNKRNEIRNQLIRKLDI